MPTVRNGVHSKKMTQDDPLGHPTLLLLERRELALELRREEREEVEESATEERELAILEREL